MLYQPSILEKTVFEIECKKSINLKKYCKNKMPKLMNYRKNNYQYSC